MNHDNTGTGDWFRPPGFREDTLAPVCPGCGRCRHCGSPAPAPMPYVGPIRYVQITPSTAPAPTFEPPYRVTW